jgi:hypothetical protein
MSLTSVAPANNFGELWQSWDETERRLLRWQQARLDLGRRMWTVGIDDGSLAAQIGVLEERIRQAAAAHMPMAALQSARIRLLLRLADLALEDDAPLPGADKEYRAARQAQTALAAIRGMPKETNATR